MAVLSSSYVKNALRYEGLGMDSHMPLVLKKYGQHRCFLACNLWSLALY